MKRQPYENFSKKPHQFKLGTLKVKLYRLEALRGFAAFYVVLHHTIPEKSVQLMGYKLGFLLRFGQEAVILFFLLSGFVINYSYKLGRDKSFSTYFSKRALRIFVPLLAVFLISYLLSSYNAKSWISPDLKTLVMNILMLQDWEVVKPNVLSPTYMGNTPLWSLSYEWWFYMLYFPIVNYLRDTSVKHILIYTLVLMSTIAYLYFPNFFFRILTYLGIWWTGVYLSDLYLDKKLDDVKSLALPIIGVTLPVVILLGSALHYKSLGNNLILGLHPVLEFRHYSFALIALVGALIWRKCHWIGFDLLFKPFLPIAPISYAIYICHHPLMAKATYLAFVANPYFRWAIYLAIVLAISWLIEIVIYRRVRNRFMPSNMRAN